MLINNTSDTSNASDVFDTSNNAHNNTVDRIRKLLKLSASSNQHEAELALSLAQKFANEQDLDLACLAAGLDECAEKYEKASIELEQKRKSITHSYVCWILTKYFNVQIINGGAARWRGVSIHFIGKASDIEAAKYIYTYLSSVLMSLWHQYRLKNPEIKTNCRESFLYGCYKGLSEKLDATRNKDKTDKFEGVEKILGNEARQNSESKYAMILLNNSNKLDNAVANFFPNLRKGTARFINNSNANVYADGIGQGRQISLNKGITSGQKCLTN